MGFTCVKGLRRTGHHTVCSVLSYVWLFATPWTVAHQATLSMEFSRQEYWGGLPFPPGNLPDPGIKFTSPALAGGYFFTTEPPGKPTDLHSCEQDTQNSVSHCCFHNYYSHNAFTISKLGTYSSHQNSLKHHVIIASNNNFYFSNLSVSK